MPKKHTFDLDDDAEEKWLKYEKEYGASFTKTANNAIKEYLEKKLGKK